MAEYHEPTGLRRVILLGIISLMVIWIASLLSKNQDKMDPKPSPSVTHTR